MTRIDPNAILAACERSMFGTEDDGFCTACGAEQMNIEPDAQQYPCDACGANAVYGAEQLLLLGYAS